MGSQGSQKSPKVPVKSFIASPHMQLEWTKTSARSRQRVAGTAFPRLSPGVCFLLYAFGPPHRVHWGQRDPGADAQTDRRHGAGQSVPTIKGNSLSPSHPALLSGKHWAALTSLTARIASRLAGVLFWDTQSPEFKLHLFALNRMPSPA